MSRQLGEGRTVETMGCVVCGLADARALVKTELANGRRVIVCATHELIHRRLGSKASSVDGLRATARERRGLSERREVFPCDELGAMLTAGFAGERRARSRRG